MMTEKDCLFCDKDNPEKHRIICENDLFYARWDNFPVSRGHAEIVPKKHIVSYFNLTEKETLQLDDLIKRTKGAIEEKYHPDGYNLGWNEGEAAGRTINHFHFHIIPRYKGDIPNPVGGIRNIIPGKGDYTKKYYKVVTQGLRSVGLLKAPQIQYKIGEWVYPLEPLSDHYRKGGGLWVYGRKCDAFRAKKYVEEERRIKIKCRVFACQIGKILYKKHRTKTDKVMLLEEVIRTSPSARTLIR